MEGTSFEKVDNWEIHKDTFAPQPSGKILKAWERAPVASHAPRLHGKKIWKRRGGLRAVENNKENYNDAFMELEKEGAGARKKARVEGNKEDISRATWHEGKDERDAWDENLMMGMGSPRKNMVGSPDKLQVVPRKRTNANLVITPKKSLRKLLLGGDGQGLNTNMPLSPVKGKDASGSPVRRRKDARKSIRKSAMPVDDAQMGHEGMHHVRHTSLEFDFEMTSEMKKTEPKQDFEQSPKKTPKRQSLRRSMRGGVSESVQDSEQASVKIDNEQSFHAGFNSASLGVEADEAQAGAMELDPKQAISSENKTFQGKEHVSGAEPVREQDPFVTPQAEHMSATTESTQNQPEDLPTQKSTRGASQRRTSSRRSTRQSDRLHLESVVGKPPSMEGADAMTSNTSTTDIRNFAPELSSQYTGDVSNFTMTSTTNVKPQGEVSDTTIEEMGMRQEESSNVELPTSVEKIDHIVEELLEAPVLANENLDSVEPQESMIRAPTDNSSVESPANINRQQAFTDFEDIQLVKESSTPHVAPLEDSGDEDIDESMSDLSEILLEPTINVSNLGLSGSNESFDNDTNEMQSAMESDPIEDPESFDLMPINSLHAKNKPISPKSGIMPAESSTACTTSSEVDDTFSLGATSSFENDDTDMLRQFINRVKADKAAKAAAPALRKRKSLPHSPVRIPLGDIMNAEASSPVQVPKDELDVSISAISSPTRKSRAVTPPSNDEAEVEVESKSIRRSRRTRPPIPKIPLPAPSSIPVRRLGGQDGDTNVTLKQSVEKELAALTRANTRRNKAGAVLPEVLLARRADPRENKAKRQKELKEMFDERARREKKGKDKMKKTVVWAEEIAQYQSLERKDKKTMESRRVNRDGERILDQSKPEEEEKVPEAKHKKARVKIPTGSSSRTSKIAVGISTTNGTPARKRG